MVLYFSLPRYGAPFSLQAVLKKEENSVIDAKTLAQRLLYEREVRGWSQQVLADKIGSSRLTVSRWEQGKTLPQPYFRQKIWELFNWDKEVRLPDAPSPASDQMIVDPATPPGPIIALVGRDALLEEIKRRLLASPPDPFLALHGLPGVGKTALAITLMHDPEVRAHFRDGMLWVGLGPYPDHSRLLSRWGALLGISSSPSGTVDGLEAWTEALRHRLAHRSLLLVIDDVWHLEDALTFKLGGPRCLHLITTRFPGIAAQLSFEGAIAIHELAEKEGMELLQRLAPHTVKREPGRAAELVRAVGGLPLALSLMGNYLRKQAQYGQTRHITAALERLSHAQERLHLSEPSALIVSSPIFPARTPLSLRSSIEVSIQLLGEQERLALAALSALPVKPESFSEEVALSVANCFVRTLDALLESGLLEAYGSGRYLLHRVVADYARFHLDAAPHQVRQAAREHLIAYEIPFVEAHWQDIELLERESQTIIAALEAAADLGRQDALVRGTLAFAPFLLLRGLYQMAERYLQRISATASLSAEDQISLLLYAGEAAFKQGRYHEAEQRFQRGLALARAQGDHELDCVFLLNLATTLSCLHPEGSPQASAYLQEGLALSGQLESGWIKTLLTFLGETSLTEP
jgi:transcriptional regulator with XRE-family HTH domain/tetratricopeptide (TPR) repeat protein